MTREVAAEFDNPGNALLDRVRIPRVIALHLALKAFYPGKTTLPANARRHHLEIPEMIEFRNRIAEQLGPLRSRSST